MQHHVYDTSYALTAGIAIRRLEAPIYPDAIKGLVVYEQRGICRALNAIPPSRWHATKGEAIAAAEAQRERKIASLEKQIRKLRDMTFNDCPDLPEEYP
jgi:hypothetical protein